MSGITRHEIAVYRFIRSQGGWITVQEIVRGTGVARRTVAHHVKRLTDEDVLDRFFVFDGYRYRMKLGHERTDRAKAIDRTAEILGIE